MSPPNKLCDGCFKCNGCIDENRRILDRYHLKIAEIRDALEAKTEVESQDQRKVKHEDKRW